jgi:hypothetical protein
LDQSSGIGFILLAGLLAEPLPISENYVTAVDISSVVVVN